MESQSILKAKSRFDSELHTEKYKKVHSDTNHLEALLDLMEFSDGGAYLDLGTGNGYVALAIAEGNNGVTVEGLDIAELSIIENNVIVQNRKLKNVKFQSYGGSRFPYKDNSFNGIISRYAFHHFPDIVESIKEIDRVLLDNGYFVLSDPLSFDKDSYRFIDKFQDLNNDGHIHFYYKNEIENHFIAHGFIQEKSFLTDFTITRDYDNRYKNLISHTPDKIQDLYKVKIHGGKIRVKISILNALFRKTRNVTE